MKILRFSLLMILLALLIGTTNGARIRADDSAGAPLFEEEGIGVATLFHAESGEVDIACLTGLIRKLAEAIDNHEVSYLKMMINPDDDIVTQIISGRHIRVDRTVPTGNFVVSLKPGQEYFLSVMGKQFYTAGILPSGLDFSKCAGGEN